MKNLFLILILFNFCLCNNNNSKKMKSTRFEDLSSDEDEGMDIIMRENIEPKRKNKKTISEKSNQNSKKSFFLNKSIFIKKPTFEPPDFITRKIKKSIYFELMLPFKLSDELAFIKNQYYVICNPTKGKVYADLNFQKTTFKPVGKKNGSKIEVQVEYKTFIKNLNNILSYYQRLHFLNLSKNLLNIIISYYGFSLILYFRYIPNEKDFNAENIDKQLVITLKEKSKKLFSFIPTKISFDQLEFTK